MGIPNEQDIIGINGLKKVLFVYLLCFVGFGFLGPLGLAFEIFQLSESLALPSVESIVFPILKTFGIGLLISLVIGRWVTSRLVAHYKKQHQSQGVVLDNKNSIFANFGFNLGMGTFIGISFFEGFVCQIPITEDVSSSLAAIFACKTGFNTFIALIVGIIIGLGIWLIYQVVSIEKETNQKMVVQFYSTRQWGLIGIAGVAVTVFVIGLMFYKIFTLGQF